MRPARDSSCLMGKSIVLCIVCQHQRNAAWQYLNVHITSIHQPALRQTVAPLSRRTAPTENETLGVEIPTVRQTRITSIDSHYPLVMTRFCILGHCTLQGLAPQRRQGPGCRRFKPRSSLAAAEFLPEHNVIPYEAVVQLDIRNMMKIPQTGSADIHAPLQRPTSARQRTRDSAIKLTTCKRKTVPALFERKSVKPAKVSE
jgi:hypothetical protein